MNQASAFCDPIIGIDSYNFKAYRGRAGCLVDVSGFYVSAFTRIRSIEFLIGDKSFPAAKIEFPRHSEINHVSGTEWRFTSYFEVSSALTDGSYFLHAKFQWDNNTNTDISLGPIELISCTFNEIDEVDVDSETVAICMATYNPNLFLLRRQIESIKQQSYQNWICLIQDDCSPPEAVSTIRKLICDDRRFLFIANNFNVGFYRNFELALNRVPERVGYFALADQDDVWHTDKLKRLVKKIKNSESSLIVSDCNVVDEYGNKISETFWTKRANTTGNWKNTFFLNSVTGCCSLVKREVLMKILPFPVTGGLVYHDHWIACVAHFSKGVSFSEECLVNYVQHSNNHTGVSSPEAPSWNVFLKELIKFSIAILVNSLFRSRKLGVQEVSANMSAYFRQEVIRQRVFAKELLIRLDGLDREKKSFLKSVSDSSFFYYLKLAFVSIFRRNRTLYAEAHSFFCIFYYKLRALYFYVRRFEIKKQSVSGER